VEAVAWDGYLSSLRDAGWAGHADLVRLECAVWLAPWVGASAPAAVTAWVSGEDHATAALRDVPAPLTRA
jgi:hypothetical protein